MKKFLIVLFAGFLTAAFASAQNSPQPPNTTAYILSEGGSLQSLTNGNVTTLESTNFCDPGCYDFARDGQGNLVVAGGSQILKYSPTGTLLSTINAPEGSNFFSVAVDGQGNYIVGDNVGHQILRITPDGLSLSVVYVYATNVPGGYYEHVYVRIDASGNYVIAEDLVGVDSPQQLTMFVLTPAGNATFVNFNGLDFQPGGTSGFVILPGGDYVNFDWHNNQIYRVTAASNATSSNLAGRLTILFSDPNEVFSRPESISFDPASGYYFLVDDVNNAVYTLNGFGDPNDGKRLTTIASGGSISLPGAILVTNTGARQPFVMERSAVIVPVPSGQSITCPTTACPTGVYDIIVDGQGNFIVTAVSTLVKITPAGVASVIATAPQGSAWISVALDPAGNYIVTDNQGDQLQLVTPSGQVSTIANYPVALQGALEDVFVRVDNAGNYIEADDNNQTGNIHIITPQGSVSTLNITGATFSAISGITIDGNGNYVIADYGTGRIYSIAPDGTGSVLYNNRSGTLTFPYGIYYDPVANSFLLTDENNGALYSLSLSGALTRIATGFVQPRGVVIDAIGTTSGLSITTSSLPTATQGSFYSTTLAATGGSGSLLWSATGLPAGLTLSTDGLLSGTPASNGNFGVSITVTDSLNSALHATTTLSLYVAPPATPPLVISGANSVSIAAGGSVSGGFSLSGGTSPYSFKLSGLPAGISISSTGALSGTVTAPGTYFGTVYGYDSLGATTVTSLTINVLGLTTTALPAGAAGQPYSTTLSAVGGASGYSFSATNVPPGLSLLSSGTLAGTPTTPNTYTMNVTVSSGAVSATGAVTITINKPLPLSISNSTLQDGTVNARYSQQFTASGGYAPYKWTLVSGTLPAGLSLNPSGVVSGIPTVAGKSTFGIQVTDNAGASVTSTANITIAPAPVVITTKALPSGMNGVAYPQIVLGASGGTTPYAWKLTGGSLPSNLALSGDGILSGAPGALGDFSPVITVTDANGKQATATYSLNVRPASADLQLSAGALTFQVLTPGSSLPPAESVGVLSTDASQRLNFTVSANSAPWFTLSNGTTTPDSIQVSLTAAALSLTPGDYTATVTATCTSAACNGRAQSFAVDLNVANTPANLVISTDLLSFTTTTVNTSALSQSINLQNAGGGSIGFASIRRSSAAARAQQCR